MAARLQNDLSMIAIWTELEIKLDGIPPNDLP